MKKSKVFILAVIVLFIIMGGLYFYCRRKKSRGMLFHQRPAVYRNRRIRMMKHLVL